MELLSIILVLVVVGVVLWLITTYIPMAPPIRTILTVVVIIAVCLWLLSAISGVGRIRIG